MRIKHGRKSIFRIKDLVLSFFFFFYFQLNGHNIHKSHNDVSCQRGLKYKAPLSKKLDRSWISGLKNIGNEPWNLHNKDF